MRLAARLTHVFERIGRNQNGQVAVMFALWGTVLVTAIGAGLDLSRAFVARQQLSNAATLTCQYSARPAVVSAAYNGGAGPATYTATVDAYAAKFVQAQNFPFTQTNSSPFTYSQGVASSVNFTATVPTIIMGIVGVKTMPISSTVNCATDQTEVDDTNPSIVLSESFESEPCTGSCWGGYSPSGQINAFSTTPTNTFPKVSAYTGQTNAQWTVMGYCLEVDYVGRNVNTVPDGTHEAELDCDNGSSPTAGNSSISNKSYYTVGAYELRYNYTGRADYPNYDPTYICGSTAADVSWANDTTSNFGTKLRTNQINVYFDADNSGSAGTHATIYDSQQLAGVNLIDMCVYSPNWIQRSVKINVTTAGYYWLSFAADGADDGQGGQLDNIQVCRNSCSGSVTDNFPSRWTSSPSLFEDTFEKPVYSKDAGAPSAYATGGNLASSYGTSGSTSSGWPYQSASGWAVAPYNEVNYWLQGAAQGNQFISLQGWNTYSNTSDPIDRSISRSFLLDPGYYKLQYYYTSLAEFSYSFVYSNSYVPICWQYPTGPFGYSVYGIKYGRDYPNANAGQLYGQYLSTNFINVYMSNGQLVSTPNINSTLGGAPTYTNPDGTTTATPTAPLDNGSNFSAFNTSVNAVVESCYYSGGFVWVQQTLYVKITKPGWYWLSFSALGDPLTGGGAGPAIDDVALTAQSSLYGTPPSSSIAVPTASAAPGSTISYTGFSIVADPLKP